MHCRLPFQRLMGKIGPVEKHSFPEYAIYLRKATCTVATGQGLDGISLGGQSFGVTSAILKLLSSLNCSWNYLMTVV